MIRNLQATMRKFIPFFALLISVTPWLVWKNLYLLSIDKSISHRPADEAEGAIVLLGVVGACSFLTTPLLHVLWAKEKTVLARLFFVTSTISCILFQINPATSLSVLFYSKHVWIMQGTTSAQLRAFLFSLPPIIFFLINYFIINKMKTQIAIIACTILSLCYIPVGYFLFK